MRTVAFYIAPRAREKRKNILLTKSAYIYRLSRKKWETRKKNNFSSIILLRTMWVEYENIFLLTFDFFLYHTLINDRVEPRETRVSESFHAHFLLPQKLCLLWARKKAFEKQLTFICWFSQFVLWSSRSKLGFFGAGQKIKNKKDIKIF